MDELKPLKVNYPKFDAPETEELTQYKQELNKITDEAFANASTTRTLKNIRNTLIKGLKIKYDITDKDELTRVSDALLKIHGLHEVNFDFMSSFSTLVDNQAKLNDISIDSNANKSERNIKGSLKEIELSIDKLIGFDMLYRVMKEMYGQEEAKRLSGEMYDYSLGLSDSSNILIPYCWALDASKIVTAGRDFGILPSKPAKRVSSYISALCETVHQLSSHLAGAIAIGTFFLDITHLLVYKQRVPLSKLKDDKDVRKSIENEFQQFIHSVNHLSRNGIESPFTNVSIFDHDKLSALIGKENYGWYFPKMVKVLVDNDMQGEDDDYKNVTEEQYKEFILSYIFEVQKIYVDLFDKGDPSNGGLQYRFPVTTINLSKYENEEGKLQLDPNNELVNYIVKKDISKYNIFVSEGTKVASCCRMINNQEMMDMASSVNSFGGGNISLGSHRVVTINFARIAYEADNYDSYLQLLRERVESSAKILKAHKVLILKLTELGLEPFIKNYWINMGRMFSTFGVLGIVEAGKILLARFDNNEFDYIKDIMYKFNGYCKEEAAKYNLIHNIEQIPAETFAVRLADADKILFENPYNLDPLYANQFVALWQDATIYEKMDRDGEVNQLLTGGGIVHIQVGSDVTATQAKNLIQYSVKSGSEHFALNAVYSKCEDCGHVAKDNFKICPKCGSEHTSHFTRVIGFFTQVESWNKTRREWEFPKRKFTDLNSLK
jgi:ribonucleoside-triphosphate reductase